MPYMALTHRQSLLAASEKLDNVTHEYAISQGDSWAITFRISAEHSYKKEFDFSLKACHAFIMVTSNPMICGVHDESFGMLM